MRIALLGLPALMLSSSALFAAGDVASLAVGAEAKSARANAWLTPAGGLERANQVIGQCLAQVDQTPRQSRYSCVRAAYEACEIEHGTSQRDMNECSALSYEAWNARIADVMASVARAKSSETRLGLKAEEAKHQLVESQLRWSEWNAADCELQAKGTEGGTIRPFAISICLSDHAAVRAIDLQAIIERWLG
jgi:uncharacterized protein YecT (DUF1311 family)